MKYFFTLFLLATCVITLVAQQQNYQKLDILMLKGDYLGVCLCADSILKTTPNDNEILYRKALAQRKNYKYKEALKSILKTIDAEPNNKKFLLEYGKALTVNSKPDSARKVFEKIFYTIDSTDINNGILLARNYDKTKDWKNSIYVYSCLSNLDKTNTYFLYKWSLSLTKQKQGKEAIPLLLKTIELDFEHIKARHLLFKIYRAVEKHELAIAHLDTIKQIQPCNAEWYVIAGHFHAGKNHYYNALPEFKKAIELGMVSAETMNYTGICLFHIKKYSEAIPYLKFDEKLNATEESLWKIGKCYQELAKTDSALIYYKKSQVFATPNAFFFQKLYAGIAELHIINKEYNEAIALNKQLIILMEESEYSGFINQYANKSIAEIYVNHLNQPKKALNIYQKQLANMNKHNNPYLFQYYEKKIEQLKEQVFFEGNN